MTVPIKKAQFFIQKGEVVIEQKNLNQQSDNVKNRVINHSSYLNILQ